MELVYKEFEKKAFRKRLKSHIWGIIISVVLIIVTAILVYFYPKIECNKRLLFLISSVWPSGVIVVLVPVWTEFVRDLRGNIGYDIDKFLQEEVSQKYADSPKEGDILRIIIAQSKELHSGEKATRRKAFKNIVEQINREQQSQ